MRGRPASAAVALAVFAASAAASQDALGRDDLDVRLARIGERVAEYYARARSITSIETVRLQPLSYDLTPVGFPRQLVYELRTDWEPPADGNPAEASVLRQILTVNGRPARPDTEPECMDPRAVSPEALSMLLPHRRSEFSFTWAGSGRTDGRRSVTIDYRSLSTDPAEIIWRGDCVTVSLPGQTRGRIWVDVDTHDVLRLDEHLIGMFEFRVPPEQTRRGGPLSMVIERADSSIRYQTVTFEDPDETLMLPRSIETLTVWRNAGTARMRTTQRFSDHKRFITEGRIVR